MRIIYITLLFILVTALSYADDITASSSLSPVTRLIDGDYSSAWGSNGNGLNQWVAVSFAESKTITSVTMIIYPSTLLTASSIDLQYTEDGENWTLAKSYLGLPTALTSTSLSVPLGGFEPFTCISFRLVCKSSITSWQFRELFYQSGGSSISPELLAQSLSFFIGSITSIAFVLASTTRY